ncbi:MAG: amino acid adenylation domain-containing protein [Clostridia bacterium]|nr:amino acid adenylation domain-containing protein [Clostridia bacterium]
MKQNSYELTNPQKSIWLTEQYNSHTNLNNISGYLHIQEKVDFKALDMALNEYIRVNESTRMQLTIENGTPVQYVKEYSYCAIPCTYLKSPSDLKAFNQEIMEKPFTLIDAPLYSLTMFQFEDGSGGFNATLHHLITDAWSMSLLISEIMNFYSKIISHQSIDEEMPLYTEYIYAEQNYLASSKFQKDKEFWNNIFDSSPELLTIVQNKVLDAKSNTKACRASYTFDKNFYQKLNDFCQKTHCSMYTFLMAIYSIYLAKLNNSRYSIMGTPVLNRTNFKEKHTSGMFISTIPFKIEVPSYSKFEDFLKNVASTQMSIFRHQKYPYASLLEDLKKKYNFTENLYDIALSYQNARDNREDCCVPYSSQWLFSGHVSDTLQIHFYDMDNTGELNIFYDYQISKLSKDDINKMHLRILSIIEQILKSPELCLSQLEILTLDERKELCNRYQQNILVYPKKKSIIELWEEQVAISPSATAILSDSSTLTYQDLKEKVDALALYLQQSGVQKGEIVPTFLHRSPELIISLLAIMKCGGVYLPISTSLPDNRIDYILKDSHAKRCITVSNLIGDKHFSVAQMIALDTLKLSENVNIPTMPFTSPNDAIYTIYTSGSTGNPKGVVVTNQNLNNFIHSFQEYFQHQVSGKDICLASTNISFDVSIWEFFFTLLNGASLYLFDEDSITDIFHYCDTIIQNNVTMLYIPPNILENVYQILSEQTSIALNKILVGVEPIRNSTIQKFFTLNNQMQIVNGYGPTETTICCTAYVVHKNEACDSVTIPIGKPLYNLNAYIVDTDLKLVPNGVAGELLIGGDNVTKGYLGREDLTCEKYIESPFHIGEFLYRTGDIVKFMPDGNLTFIGRNDHQVKLRGHRIELGEVENTILDYVSITKCKVLLKNDNTIMAAFFTATEEILANDLRDFLSKKLPLYAIPNSFMQLSAFPLTSNGKIDTASLEQIELKNTTTYLAPTTPLEKDLATIWENLLGSSPIGLEDNFFYLGGDSLACIKLISEIYTKIGTKLAVKDIFDYPTLKELAHHIHHLTNQQEATCILPAPLMNSYPLSNAQKRIYFVANQNPESLLYNIAGGVSFNTVPDAVKLETSFQKLIQKYDALRTYFTMEDGDVVQKIEPTLDFHLEVSKADTFSEELLSDFVTPFEMNKAPLFRAKLVIHPHNCCTLLLDMHHIISDGASVGIFIQDLCNEYNQLPVIKGKLDYKDFAVWENEQMQSGVYEKSKNFWVNQFQDNLPVLTMPTTYSRPTKQSFEGNHYTFSLNTNMYQQIMQFAKENTVTPYMILLSAYYILLSKYSGQEDIIVGTPIIGRNKEELSSMLGMFVNSLPFRRTVDTKSSFLDFTTQLKDYCLACFEHQDFPFNELVSALNLKRDISRNPLFDTMFIYQNDGYPDFNLNGVSGTYHASNLGISKFDFSLEVIPFDTQFELTLEYCTKLFDLNFAKRFAIHYQTILQNLLYHSSSPISSISMLSKEEEKQILQEFNNTTVPYPNDKNIVTLWEDQVKLTPHKKAIIFENTNMTYQELDEKANQLAHFLQKNGALEGEIIPILLDKSLEMIVSILAILKVGAAFLPIDVYYPKDRIDYIIRDSNAKLLLTNSGFIHKANSSVKALSVELDNIIYQTYPTNSILQNYSPETIAYIMYTSGSTGRPKGTMITHKNIIRLVKNNAFITFEKEERILQTGSIVFDACTFEIWASLLNGFELYIMKKEELLDASLLQDYLIKNKITILWLTAPLFNQLCEDNPHMFRTVRVLLTGGDVLSPRHINLVRSANPNLTIINGYGPTENTTFSCCFTIDKTYQNSIPIGGPISNSTAYVVSSTGNLQPVGVPGELWVGGDGVGKGYYHNLELTNEKFIPNPFDKGVVYKTGDLVKWRDDGTIDFLGRIDNQVKIRGFRVELGEINLHISRFSGIKGSITTISTIQNEKVICTYFVADNTISVPDLKKHLSQFLPAYMIPTYFMQLKKLPINTNGKVDKNALPTNFEKNTIRETSIIAPQNETEELIVSMFKKILNLEEVSVTDSFFEIGGDSLTAMKLQVEALSHNLSISYGDIFEFTTVRALANHIIYQNSVLSNEPLESQYVQYDSLISKNVVSQTMKLCYTPISNVLLTGFTGFLGAHVLDSYLKNEKGTIYCLIRGKDNMTAKERLENVLHFYFNTKYDAFIGSRIQLVEGDITLPNLGLSNEDYQKLGNSLDTIIHCAALVKHFGNYEDFKAINIDGTQKIVDFCQEFHLKLLHVSTISVSGNNLAEGSNVENNFKDIVDFDETNFYIGQNLKNAYIHSKFEAERIVLDAIHTGLEACILRMGNLTSRFSEGKFQQNHFENAFVNRIKSFLQIGYMPDYMLNLYAEFTPIDYCGDAIIKIASYFNKDYTVFHLLNENHVNLDVMYNTMTKLGIHMQIVSSDEFTKILDDLLQNPDKKSFLNGIVNDLNAEKKLVYQSEVAIKSDFTKEFLKKTGFEWPIISEQYLRNYFKYLSDIGYFSIHIN